jgi:hypothetical protein
MYRRTNLTMYWRTNLTMYWRTNAVMQLCIGVGKACIYFPTSVYILAGGRANSSICHLSLTNTRVCYLSGIQFKGIWVLKCKDNII